MVSNTTVTIILPTESNFAFAVEISAFFPLANVFSLSMISRLYSGGALERVGWKKIALIFVALHAGACFFYFFVSSTKFFFDC